MRWIFRQGSRSGMRIGRELGLLDEQLSRLYYALLLKDCGCSGNSSLTFNTLKSDELKAKFDAKVTNWTSTNWETAHYAWTHVADLRGLKTLLDLHNNGVGSDGSFGVIVRPARRFSLQAAYRTPSHITSTGTATGNMGAQFAAAGIPFQPTFSYDPQVKVKMPQSASVTASWQATPEWHLNAQADFVNWKNAFYSLPVALTHGSNADINGFLGSSSLNDTVPLEWKNQFTFRGSVERAVGERFSVTGGYKHSTDPVPSSTLTPLTAAIMQNGISGGVGYRVGVVRFDLAYGFNFSAR